MLDYLVTSKARRQLLHLLWVQREVASVSELARHAGVSFSSAQAELGAMERAGLANSSAHANTVEYRANFAHSQSALLRRLLATNDVTETSEPHDDEVRSWLVHYGAPLAAVTTTASAPSLETVLVQALRVAHRDPSITRSLPVLLWQRRNELDWASLAESAKAAREEHTLGFFTELAGLLAHNRELQTKARSLRDARRRVLRPFFDGQRGRYGRAIAAQNTPAVAKRWGYEMNMPLQSFASTFEKFSS